MVRPIQELRHSFERKKKDKGTHGKSFKEKASASIRRFSHKRKSVFKKKSHTHEEELEHAKKVSAMYALRIDDLKEENEDLICKLQREKIWHHKHKNIAQKHRSLERSYIELNEKHEELRDLAFQLQQKLKAHKEKSKGMSELHESSDSLMSHVGRMFAHNEKFGSFIAEMKEDMEDEIELSDDEK